MRAHARAELDAFAESRGSDRIYRYRVLLVGSQGVGKSSLVFQNMGDNFDPRRQPSLGLPTTIHIARTGDELLVFEFVHCSGDLRFRQEALNQAVSSEGIIVVFDTNDKRTFQEARRWLKDLSSQTLPFQRKVALVANKFDMHKDRPAASLDEAQSIARESGAAFYHTDARTGRGVAHMFQHFGSSLPRTDDVRRRAGAFFYHDPHFYHDPPIDVDDMHARLEPARAIADEGVPVMVWAEDLLALTQYTPTGLMALQLIVPDVQVDVACAALRRQGFDVHPTNDYEYRNRLKKSDEPSKYHTSTRYLRRQGVSTEEAQSWYFNYGDAMTIRILLHAASAFHLSFNDPKRLRSVSPPLSSANSRILVPTRGALLDALIESILEPSISATAPRSVDSLLNVYISYILMYNCREEGQLTEEGFFTPPILEMLEEVRPENRRYLETVVLRNSSPWKRGLGDQRQERRDLLAQQAQAAPHLHDRAGSMTSRRPFSTISTSCLHSTRSGPMQRRITLAAPSWPKRSALSQIATRLLRRR